MSILLSILFIPLAGALFLMFVSNKDAKLIKNTALILSTATFIISLGLLLQFDYNNPNFQLGINVDWVPQFDAGFRVGVDGMSLLLVLLTTFITPIAILSSYSAIQKREKEYYVMILFLQFAMTGVFIALDLFLFYIFWELILIPMYFIIGIWGGKERLYATVKFFIFTVVGSLFMLIAIVWLGIYAGSTVLHMSSGFTSNFVVIRQALENQAIPMEIQKWIFLAFAL